MSDNNNHPLGEAPWLHVLLSTGLGTGFIPGAPGTYAAFLALLVWYGLYWLMGPWPLLLTTLGLLAITMPVGAWTSRVMERYWGDDPRTVVIDEYVGTWMAALVAWDANPWLALLWGFLGFAFFRVIDITKPLGCRAMERFGKGWGVMLDDLLAGFYAMILLALVRLVVFIL